MSAAVGAAAGAAPAPGVARVSGMRKCASMASRFPAAACQFRAAPPTRAWAPSPSHRRHAEDAARRLSVRAASSKASKVGRFPPTPATDAHPLVEEGVDLGELCARWRADAGKPGATVMREVQTMLRGGDARRHLASADGFGHEISALSAGDAEDSEDWRLLLSHKNENLYNAFALEVAALAPKSTGLTTGLFALPKPLPEPTLARMAGLRATVDPLACAADADALSLAVRALRVGSSLGATPVALYHDCVARHPTRVPSPELYDTLRDAMEAWGGGFKHGVYARFKNPNDPESIRGARETLRFCVVETSAGYVFGLTTYAPPRFHAKTDWSRKPNNYSAGTQPSIAGVAVNAVFAPGGDENETDFSPWAALRARGVILDPCCGGGTILHAAWSRGYRAMGGDINAQNARNANGNLASFRRAMPAQHASLAECDAGTPYELERLPVVGDDKNDETSETSETSARGEDHPSEPIRVSSPRRPSRMLTPTPTVTVADAITVSPAAWRAAAAERFGDPEARVAAVVSNLPFGRQVSVGGKLGGGRRGEATMEELEPLLLALRDVAPRHAFVTGAPVASTMRALGYANVTDVSLCRHGRMYLTTAYGERGAYDKETLRDLNRQDSRGALGETSSSSSEERRQNVPRPSVAFTVEASEKARAENGYVYGDVPEWVERLIASGDVDRASGSRLRKQKSGDAKNATFGDDEGDASPRRFSRPPLRVAVDTSYEQDSARAIRSVAKQLSECIGVKRRARKDAAPEHAVDVQLTFAGWRGAVAEHALVHFNAARWTEAAMDPRDVEDIFKEAGYAGISIPADSEEDAGGDGGDASVFSRGGSPASPPKRLVYLSPDADEALEDVEEDTMYVIGGIVDLAARGVAWSLPKATALGIQTARLPIRENLPSVTNQILNIDTALKVLCEKYSGKDWEDALRAALPTRQQGERPARKNRPLVGSGDKRA